MVELLVYIQAVGGSKPSPRTNFHARVDELVESLVREARLNTSCWRFESSLGHQIQVTVLAVIANSKMYLCVSSSIGRVTVSKTVG